MGFFYLSSHAYLARWTSLLVQVGFVIIGGGGGRGGSEGSCVCVGVCVCVKVMMLSS